MLFQHKELLSDEALIRLIRLGDRDGSLILHRRFRQLILHVAVSIVRDLPQAKMIVREVLDFVGRHASEHNLNQGSAKAWILRQTYRVSFGNLARRNSDRKVDHRQLAAPKRVQVVATKTILTTSDAGQQKCKKHSGQSVAKGRKAKKQNQSLNTPPRSKSL